MARSLAVAAAAAVIIFIIFLVIGLVITWDLKSSLIVAGFITLFFVIIELIGCGLVYAGCGRYFENQYSQAALWGILFIVAIITAIIMLGIAYLVGISTCEQQQNIGYAIFLIVLAVSMIVFSLILNGNKGYKERLQLLSASSA